MYICIKNKTNERPNIFVYKNDTSKYPNIFVTRSLGGPPGPDF